MSLESSIAHELSVCHADLLGHHRFCAKPLLPELGRAAGIEPDVPGEGGNERIAHPRVGAQLALVARRIPSRSRGASRMTE